MKTKMNSSNYEMQVRNLVVAQFVDNAQYIIQRSKELYYKDYTVKQAAKLIDKEIKGGGTE